ncbi:MAG: hypothetical protein U9R79_19295 [Armatimonadota bacterium]|nr:hypothetical protein [Armatimonadota bacterium]
MMRLCTGLLLVAFVLVLLAGCAERQAQQPMKPPPQEVAAGPAEAPDTVELTAYINVTSGCQEPTVELLKELAQQYDDVIDMEVIDFGSPEGNERWREDGLKCMALMFDGSPVVRIPGEDGEKRTVIFYFPVGFSWTHQDLKQTFAAIAAGEAEILSEEEARKALAPVPVEVEVEVREVAQGAEVVMNGEVAFTITQEAGGKTPLQRAQAAREALEEWTSEPVHTTQLSVMDAEKGWSILAEGKELIRVYPADADAAGVEQGKKHAAEWMKGIKGGIVAAVRAAQESAGEEASSTEAE